MWSEEGGKLPGPDDSECFEAFESLSTTNLVSAFNLFLLKGTEGSRARLFSMRVRNSERGTSSMRS